jgi:hypothetical protein
LRKEPLDWERYPDGCEKNRRATTSTAYAIVELEKGRRRYTVREATRPYVYANKKKI